MRQTLADSLHAWAAKAPPRHAVAQTVLALAEAAKQIAGLLALGPLAGSLGATVSVNAGRDEQKKLDVLAHQICVDALRGAPVAAIASEEEDHAMECDTTAPLVVAIDPLDGSSNIETNLSVGTIFSLRAAGRSGSYPWRGNPSLCASPRVRRLSFSQRKSLHPPKKPGICDQCLEFPPLG